MTKNHLNLTIFWNVSLILDIYIFTKSKSICAYNFFKYVVPILCVEVFKDQASLFGVQKFNIFVEMCNATTWYDTKLKYRKPKLYIRMVIIPYFWLKVHY